MGPEASCAELLPLFVRLLKVRARLFVCSCIWYDIVSLVLAVVVELYMILSDFSFGDCGCACAYLA